MMSCPKCHSAAVVNGVAYESILECLSCGFQGTKIDMKEIGDDE